MRYPSRWRTGVAIWLVAILGAIGCGRRAHELETAPVRGTVILDGSPVKSGNVVVLPQRGRMARGSIQPDGTFVLGTYSDDDGAQVGVHPVIVMEVPKEEMSRIDAENRTDLPEKYASPQTSQLHVEVHPDEDNVIKIELTTEKP